MPARIQNKAMGKALKYWLPVLAFMALIFYASSISGDNIPGLFPSQDVVFHFLVYSMLSFFFSRALKSKRDDLTAARVVTAAVFFGAFYGVTDEFHQSFVSLRTASLSDLFIDAAGSLIGALVYVRLKEHR